MSGVGVIVYYDGNLYGYEWCKSLKKAFKRYRDVISEELISEPWEEVNFDRVGVLLIYNYEEYCRRTKEATIS